MGSVFDAYRYVVDWLLTEPDWTAPPLPDLLGERTRQARTLVNATTKPATERETR